MWGIDIIHGPAAPFLALAVFGLPVAAIVVIALLHLGDREPPGPPRAPRNRKGQRRNTGPR